MRIFNGFHDAVIEYLSFKENHEVSELSLLVDNSNWYGKVELKFEGVIVFKMMPSDIGHFNHIFQATLIVNNNMIFWADDHLDKEDLTYEGSYIKALNLKWRDVR